MKDDLTDRTSDARQLVATVAPVVSALMALMLLCSTARANDDAAPAARAGIGQSTRAWLDEQRNEVNRAEPEPYPASRAAAAVQRYESTVGSDSGSSATRAGTGIGIRGGSPAAGSTPSPGMGR